MAAMPSAFPSTSSKSSGSHRSPPCKTAALPTTARTARTTSVAALRTKLRTPRHASGSARNGGPGAEGGAEQAEAAVNVRALWHVRDASGEQNVADRSELHGLAEKEEHDVAQAGRRLLDLRAKSVVVGFQAESAQALVLSARIIVSRAVQCSAAH